MLFDLDDTLVVEEPAAAGAFEATARLAAESHPLDVEALARSARSNARDLWHAGAMHSYCRRVGISSWEGLWCRFEGQHPDVRALRQWAPGYRREAWALALGEQGVLDEELAAELGERFGRERRSRHEVFADASDCLEALGESHQLGLITNGAACLQREKLCASGLAGCFEVVVVSSEFGLGKPAASIFLHALRLLGADARETVMVGDSVPRDIAGATAVGMRGVWVNRGRAPRPPDGPEMDEIYSLSDLAGVLERLSQPPAAGRL